MSPRDASPGESLLADAPCGLLVTRPDGLILQANRTFCRWIGAESADVVGVRRFQDFLSVGGRIFHHTHFAPLMKMRGSISELKLDLGTAAHGTLPIMVNAAQQELDGEPCHVLAVFVAQERHAYERELMRARRQAEELAEQYRQAQDDLRDADERKDEFLAMLAHELRNPLAPIATSTQLLRLAAGDPGRVRQVAGVIERQIGHLTNIVDDLLDVSRVTRGLINLDRRIVGVAEATASAVEQSRALIESRGHRLTLDIEPGLVVEGDATRLVQIIANLLNNAAKYTPQGGAIALRGVRRDGRVELSVQDNGIGIEPKLLPRLFDLFSQAERTPDRAQGGLGIGLALVKSLVALHGGTIVAESDGPHRGSRFSVSFPLPVAPASLDPPSTESPTKSETAAVLLVDDNEDAIAVLADVLRFEGHEVRVAHTGQDALQRAISGVRRFDVCILDIGLPDMTGYELAAKLQRLMPSDPPLLIAVTGYGQTHDRVLSKAAGFAHHLVKPADPAVIVELVAAAAAQRKPARVAGRA